MTRSCALDAAPHSLWLRDFGACEVADTRKATTTKGMGWLRQSSTFWLLQCLCVLWLTTCGSVHVPFARVFQSETLAPCQLLSHISAPPGAQCHSLESGATS